MKRDPRPCFVLRERVWICSFRAWSLTACFATCFVARHSPCRELPRRGPTLPDALPAPSPNLETLYGSRSEEGNESVAVGPFVETGGWLALMRDELEIADDDFLI